MSNKVFLNRNTWENKVMYWLVDKNVMSTDSQDPYTSLRGNDPVFANSVIPVTL